MGNCVKPVEPLGDSMLKDANLPIVFVLGGPGAGKGTQCQRISGKYDFIHISSGDLLREEVATNSARGATLAKIMAEGKLVPANIVLDLIKEKMAASLGRTKGFLLDGFPREKAQCKPFERQVAPVDLVVYLVVTDEVMRDRLLGRAVTSGRSDDNDETIGKRIKLFHKCNDSVVRYYREKLTTVDATRDVDSVFGDVCRVVNEMLEKRRER